MQPQYSRRRSNVSGDTRFRFCPNVIKFTQILITFSQISLQCCLNFDLILLKFFQICPNLTNFKNFLRDKDASPAPTVLRLYKAFNESLIGWKKNALQKATSFFETYKSGIYSVYYISAQTP